MWHFKYPFLTIISVGPLPMPHISREQAESQKHGGSNGRHPSGCTGVIQMASSSEKPTDSETTEGESWQFNKSVAECNHHMLEHGIATDVTFVVSDSDRKSGGEASQFCAHKYMLISRSPVLYSMLCGDLAEKGKITVTDVDPLAFKQMLNYIYTDDPDLRPELVLFILYASKKYMLPGLTKKCTDYLKDQLEANNACIILDQSLVFDEKELAERCTKLINNKTKAAFNSDSFTGVRQNVLSKILDSNMFSMKEVDVFKACMKWADGKCQEQNMETTGENRRKVLGDCFTQFRFGDIEIGDFAPVVGLSEILTEKEELGIYRHLANKKSIPAPSGLCSDSRFIPGHYEIISTEKIQQAHIVTTNFQIAIKCDCDIKVIALVIGTWSPMTVQDVYKSFISVTTSLLSVTHNGVNVSGACVARKQDGQKQERTFTSPIIIKSGETTLTLQYSNNYAQQAPVHVILKNEVVLNDEHINMELKSDKQWMPIIGVKYEMA